MTSTNSEIGTVLAAYLSNNTVPVEGIAAAASAIRTALAEPTTVEVEPTPTVDKPTSAQIKKSITPDALISFIDGKAYKTLKRHLGTNDLDPASYRARYGLPVDYPMVAPNYSEQRSALARSLGLGQQRRKAAQA